MEFLNIDHTLLLTQQNHPVPWAFIESENDAGTAAAEIRKLCAVSAPLRVLLTRAEWWAETADFFPPKRYENRRAQFLPVWTSIAVTHNQVWSNPGLLALLVAEQCIMEWHQPSPSWPTLQEFQNRRFRYYAYHFDTAIGEWQPNGIYQRYLAGPNQNQNGQRLEGWPC
jgi:hypothetical protein